MASATDLGSRRAHGRRARLEGRAHGVVDALLTDRVAQAAVALVVVQLAFRTWMTAISWWTGDDFGFMSRMWNDGLSFRVASQPYGGHVMPGGMYATWLLSEISPYDFTLPGALLLVMQGVASIGAVLLLVRMFGLRPGILPPLALYLFSAISTPMAVWWAAAINQLPFQIVFFWALLAHLTYLRTRRARDAWIVVAWLLGGLLFYEKTILVLGAIGIVTLAYFTAGTLGGRIAWVWRRYRYGTVLYVVLGVSYLALYAAVGLNFSPAQAGSEELGGVATNMALDAYAPAMAGGPLRWSHVGQFAVPDAPAFVLLLSVVLIVVVVREAHRTRRRSLRAWWLPAFFLGCDVLLVMAGRASFVGDRIALEYRYQSELGAVTALALACAFLPIRDAVESVEPKREGRLVDRPRRVAAVTTVVAVLGVVSSATYAQHWSDAATGKPYFAHLLAPVGGPFVPVPIIDSPVPNDIMWGLTYPADLQSHLLRPYDGDYAYLTSAVDRIFITDDTGTLLPAAIPPVRTAPPGPVAACGYLVTSSPRRIPLDGPVAYGGWWARVGYVAHDSGPATITAGDATYRLDLPAGIHAIYVAAAGTFNHLVLSSRQDGFTFCTSEITVGRPEGAKINP